jgi:hypothetical protein
MNRGGGGERRHLLDFRCVSDAGAGVAIVCVAHMQQPAGLLPSACPGFSQQLPNHAMIYLFLRFKKYKMVSKISFSWGIDVY